MPHPDHHASALRIAGHASTIPGRVERLKESHANCKKIADRVEEQKWKARFWAIADVIETEIASLEELLPELRIMGQAAEAIAYLQGKLSSEQEKSANLQTQLTAAQSQPVEDAADQAAIKGVLDQKAAEDQAAQAAAAPLPTPDAASAA